MRVRVHVSFVVENDEEAIEEFEEEAEEDLSLVYELLEYKIEEDGVQLERIERLEEVEE